MSEWPTPTLRRLFRIVNGGTPTADPTNWGGDVPWATPVDLAGVNGGALVETERTLSDSGLRAGSSTVPPGSLLLSTRAPIGYVASVRRSTAFNQGCRGLVARSPMDLRFHRYQLLALTPVLQAQGQGSTFTELSSEALGAIRLVSPPIQVQRAIADYLDFETARIDALIEKKRRMVELLEERLRAEVDHLTRSEEQPEVPLRRFVAEACDGPFGSALKTEHYADWGARVIRLGNIGVATWQDDDVAFIPIPYWMNLGRHHASTGDLVIAGLGDEGNPVGRACVLPDLGPALVKADCYRLRIRPEVGDSTYLAWHLSSPRALANAARVAEGSTRARLTLGKALSLPVPLLAVERQRAIASCLVNGAAAVERLNGQVRRELSLLTERRQALITAAVTGELAIPGVAA